VFAQAARENGVRVFAVAHEGETDPGLNELAEEVLWVKIGQFKRAVDFFQKHGVADVVMAGGITKINIFKHFRPDFKTLSLMARVRDLNDDRVLRALADEFAKEGIVIRPSTIYTPQLLAPEGILTKRKPTKEEWLDIDFGWTIAKSLGRLDVGQCVVVRNRIVLALEAVDGTDETIRRGGRLAREKAVVVKVSKPGQDMRFDVPTVGPETVRVMAEVRASALAVEAGRTLIFDRREMVAAADRAGLAIVARSEVEEC